MKKTEYIIILTSVSSYKEAEKIADALVDARLASCVSILQNIKSIYKWQGKKERCRENLLFIKSKENKFKQIAKKIKSLHSYQVPEIIALPVIKGSKDYLDWIKQVIS